MKRIHALVFASILLGAAPAIAGEMPAVRVEEGSDVAENEVRRAIAAELGDSAARGGAIVVRSRGGVVRVSYEDTRGRTIEREVTAPADGAARVRLIALLAGNLARDEAKELIKPPSDDRTEVILRVPAGETARVEVNPKPAPPAPPPPAPPKERNDGSTQRMIGWIGVASGAAAAIGGVLLELSAANDRSTLGTTCAPNCLADQVDAEQRKKVIGGVLIGSGALVGIGGTILLLTAPSDAPSEPASDGATQRTLGWIGIGSGVALAGTAVVLRLLAASDRSNLEAQCVNDMCAASAKETISRAQQRETISNWFLAGGLVLGATGTILELTAPSAKNTSVAVGPSGVRVAHAF